MEWLSAGLLFFAALPSTSTYQLNSYGFGSGGTANSTTSTYKLEGTSGELSGQTASTATYSVKPGFVETQQAHVPKISSFNNSSGAYYNKLHFVIDKQNNPSDALYALSISTDNFVSDVKYVKNDLTVSSTLSLTDYQTYTAWGGVSGANIIGLQSNTTYYLRVKATQGTLTESGYGPAASATTANPQLSFSLSTNSIALGSLLPNSVVSAASPITVSFATNAASGGDVYINGLHTGLRSVLTSTIITSSSTDLSTAARGFGVRVTATSTSSGTLSSLTPYDGAADNVGITDSTIRRIMTANGPVVGGSGSVLVKAKSATGDASADDYTETLTMIASASF